MQSGTEEVLNLIFWAADLFMRPTFRNLTDSYEGWAYRNGLMRRMRILEHQCYLETRRSRSKDLDLRLTSEGRLRVLGGRDPEERWGRPWDGRWRFVIFDIPNRQNAQRVRLRRYLRTQGFGYLQNSVWISPDPVKFQGSTALDGRVDLESLILLETRLAREESNAAIVAGAWDFGKINERYARYLEVLDVAPKGPVTSGTELWQLLQWAASERAAWLEAITSDPLLPEPLLPRDYLGRIAWRRRSAAVKAVQSQLLQSSRSCSIPASRKLLTPTPRSRNGRQTSFSRASNTQPNR